MLTGLIVGTVVIDRDIAVGHFTSKEGQDVYSTAYEEALARGPAPDAIVDVPTSFGSVRMLRYDQTAVSPDAAEPDPVVLLPGTQSGAPMWVDNIPTLRAHRPVWVIDLLGQPGRSVQSRPIETAADDARWLAEALDAVPGDPAVLGHSLGGWLAANLAIHQPDAAGSIILIDPILTFSDLSVTAIFRSIPASVSWTPRSWREDFARWTANDAPVDDDPVADMIEAGMQHYSLGTPAPSRFSSEQLASVRVPVLVIVAGASRMHDAQNTADAAGQSLPDTTVVTYDGASHAITGEQPEQIASDVTRFLDRHQT